MRDPPDPAQFLLALFLAPIVGALRYHARRHHLPRAPDDIAWLAHHLGLTRRLGETIGTRAGERAISRLVPQFANIEAAIRAVLAAGSRLDAMAALTGFGRLTYIASLPAPVLAEVAAACRTEGEVFGEANCIQGLGDIALRRSDHEAARRAYEEALPLYPPGRLRGWRVRHARGRGTRCCGAQKTLTIEIDCFVQADSIGWIW